MWQKISKTDVCVPIFFKFIKFHNILPDFFSLQLEPEHYISEIIHFGKVCKRILFKIKSQTFKLLQYWSFEIKYFFKLNSELSLHHWLYLNPYVFDSDDWSPSLDLKGSMDETFHFIKFLVILLRFILLKLVTAHILLTWKKSDIREMG